MTLHQPFGISPSLKPGLNIEGAWVCLELTGGFTGDGRAIYNWSILLPDGAEYSGADLKSGVGGGTLLEGFRSLLSFLGACAESVAYQVRTGCEGENASLFPAAVATWAYDCGSEVFSMLELEIEESETDLIEA